VSKRTRTPSLRPARDVHFGAAVYGSFLAASIIVVSDSAGESARAMTVSLLASMMTFWLSHVWSEVVGEHVVQGSRFQARHVLRIARSEWPLVEAAVVPTLFLALAWAGVWSRDTGATLAFVSAIAQITGWGFVAGLRSDGTLRSAILLGAVQGLLGMSLLALKGLTH
jgi:hypothetical protein